MYRLYLPILIVAGQAQGQSGGEEEKTARADGHDLLPAIPATVHLHGRRGQRQAARRIYKFGEWPIFIIRCFAEFGQKLA